MRLERKAIAVSLAVMAAGSVAACGGSLPIPASPPPPPAHAQGATPLATATAAPLVTSRLSPVGATLTVADLNGATYAITLVKLLDPARRAGQMPGTHLIGAEFTLRGLSGNVTDDADGDAVIEGSDHHVYQAVPAALTAGPDFSSGQFSIRPGRTVTGWVSFQVQNRTRPVLVQWIPDAGTDSTAARWSA